MDSFFDSLSLFMEQFISPSENLFAFLDTYITGMDGFVIFGIVVLLISSFLWLVLKSNLPKVLRIGLGIISTVVLFPVLLFGGIGISPFIYLFTLYVAKFFFFGATIRVGQKIIHKPLNAFLGSIAGLLLLFLILRFDFLLVLISFALVLWSSFEFGSWVYERRSEDLGRAVHAGLMLVVTSLLPFEKAVFFREAYFPNFSETLIYNAGIFVDENSYPYALIGGLILGVLTRSSD